MGGVERWRLETHRRNYGNTFLLQLFRVGRQKNEMRFKGRGLWVLEDANASDHGMERNSVRALSILQRHSQPQSVIQSLGCTPSRLPVHR